MTDLQEKLQFMLFYNLVMQSPVLSGSMQSHIQLGYGNDGFQIVIDAPFYDMKEWQKNKKLVYTGKNINGVTAYANMVNESGGFGRHNKSEHWVNRVINDCCNILASEIGGEVINELSI